MKLRLRPTSGPRPSDATLCVAGAPPRRAPEDALVTVAREVLTRWRHARDERHRPTSLLPPWAPEVPGAGPEDAFLAIQTALYAGAFGPPLEALEQHKGANGALLMHGVGHWLPRWADYGCPTFDVPASALGAWLLTQCARVRVSDLRLPYDAFRVRCPVATPFSVVKADGRRRDLRWFVVHRTRGLARDRDVVSEVARHVRRGQDTAWRGCRPFVEGPDEALTVVAYASAPGAPAADATVEMLVRLCVGDPNQTLETWFRSAADKLGKDASAPTRALLNMIVGLATYLEHLAHKGAWMRPSDAPTGPGTTSLCWPLGDAIHLDPVGYEAATAYVNKFRAPARWTLMSKLFVRGHYQHYHTTKGVVLNWKEPYPRGQGMEAIARLYTVSEHGHAQEDSR